MRVDADIGYFDVMESMDPEHKGVDVEFIRPMTDDGNHTRPRVVFEYHKDRKELAIYIWANPDKEDFTECIDIPLE